ncbi:MAG TPA: hypothetical protein VNS08_01310 [Ureibacillus sp.]|nr:hypothetical protein [Ureibacillus sp.]
MERKSKLLSLLDDEYFAVGLIEVKWGVLIDDFDDAAIFVVFIFRDRVEAYFSLYDEEAPYRNYLGKGVAEDIETAKEYALADLDRQVHLNIH